MMSIFGTNRTEAFERMVVPHLDAAYALARWLTRHDEDASDVVQEASLRALKFLDGFQGTNSRAWFLSIVRNTCYTFLKARSAQEAEPLQEPAMPPSSTPAPDSAVLKAIDIQELRQAIDELPLEFREVIILRELQELSYEDVSRIAGIPIGTVMSRLSRARARLVERLTRQERRETRSGHGL